ncbi:hypothetical protein B0J14DRAFT_569875 [Halenospora varia]|nr:hypothetical protein B0J14DRAFT_569875 [Halenospora varia]
MSGILQMGVKYHEKTADFQDGDCLVTKVLKGIGAIMKPPADLIAYFDLAVWDEDDDSPKGDLIFVHSDWISAAWSARRIAPFLPPAPSRGDQGPIHFDCRNPQTAMDALKSRYIQKHRTTQVGQKRDVHPYLLKTRPKLKSRPEPTSPQTSSVLLDQVRA